jgi:1,4-alpha-glucan branching enzyme
MQLTDFDLHLFGQGTHQRVYQKLGAHPTCQNGASGVRFSVWAPNARSVSVIGDFNAWQPDASPLEPTGDSGVWTTFVPAAGSGDCYKYSILPAGRGPRIDKADPYAFAAEVRPRTASVVADLDTYEWGDATWLSRRAESTSDSVPISIYEVHLSSWRRDPDNPEPFLSYRELADTLPAYASAMGFTHIELLPVSEHPLDRSWGYQTTGYFAPSARYGTPADFMFLVDQCHQAGLGVLLDWVPAHFPKDAFALARFDGTHLYEHADPRQGEHPDWGTLIFNYGRHEVRSFLVSNAVFWLDRYHIDGLRVDAVASMLYLDYSRQPGQWLPNRFGGRENLEAISLLQQVNTAVHDEFPGALTIAEESTAWPRVTGKVEDGGLGFDLKWNMGWMHDTLQYMRRDPLYRRYHQNEMTFSLMYAFSERFVLPLSHDEVVHLKGSLLQKMPGDVWQKYANLRLLLTYMWGHPGKKLLFMGGEFGQWAEWNFEHSLDWHLLQSPGEEGAHHRGIQDLVRTVNRLYASSPALHELDFDPSGFEWIDFLDSDNSVLAFQRLSADALGRLVFICNFTPAVRQAYRIGLPIHGSFREVLNTDAASFGGSDVLNAGEIKAEAVPWHGQPFSAVLTLPPLAVSVLEPI